MTTQTPTPPAPPALATWIVPLHALVASALVVASQVCHHLPTWAQPALVLGAALVFCLGVVLYIGHRDRWSAACLPQAYDWIAAQLAELKNVAQAAQAAVPPDISTRLARLESALAQSAPGLDSGPVKTLVEQIAEAIESRYAKSVPEAPASPVEVSPAPEPSLPADPPSASETPVPAPPGPAMLTA